MQLSAPILPSLGELTYYVNYLTNMVQMSLIKHESGSVSPISIFIVFPVHSQLTVSLFCEKPCCHPQKASLCESSSLNRVCADGLACRQAGSGHVGGGRGQWGKAQVGPRPLHPGTSWYLRASKSLKSIPPVSRVMTFWACLRKLAKQKVKYRYGKLYPLLIG